MSRRILGTVEVGGMLAATCIAVLLIPVTFYVVDPSDPLIRVWEQAFPHLFTQIDLANPTTSFEQQLVAHFRYPEDLLQAQANQFARYHVTDAPTFSWRDIAASPAGAR